MQSTRGGQSPQVAHRTGAHVFGLDADPLMLWWAARAARAARGDALDVPTLATPRRFGRTTLHPPVHSAPGQVDWVCGDARNPPFSAEAFDLVTAVNLVDSVADPYVALGQCCALVRPGGRLLLAQPDSWDPTVTHPKDWLADDKAGWDEQLAGFGLRVIEWTDSLRWELRRTPRQRFTYFLHGCLAQKA